MNNRFLAGKNRNHIQRSSVRPWAGSGFSLRGSFEAAWFAAVLITKEPLWFVPTCYDRFPQEKKSKIFTCLILRFLL